MTTPADPTTRPAAAIHEIVDGGCLFLAGKDRIALLQRITTNDVKKLLPGQGSVGCFTTNKGRIVDRSRFLVAADSTIVVTNPGRADAVAQWIDRYLITEDVKIGNVTRDVAQFQLVGTDAIEWAARIDPRARDLALHAHLETRFGAIEPITLVRTEGLRDDRGILILLPASSREPFLSALDPTGALTRLDSPSWQALRIAVGIPEFGTEFGEDYNPLECGLWDSVAFDKGCYVGQEVVARLRTYDKVMKHLCRLRIEGDVLPERGTRLFADGKDVGMLTSVAGPPQLSEIRALGFVGKRTIQSKARLVIPDGPSVEVLEVLRLGTPE